MKFACIEMLIALYTLTNRCDRDGKSFTVQLDKNTTHSMHSNALQSTTCDINVIF